MARPGPVSGFAARLAFATLSLAFVLFPLASSPAAAAAQAEQEGRPLAVLFMGNSHTALHDLPGMVAAILSSARPSRRVDYVEAPGWMTLNARGAHGPSLELLRGRAWTHVVLQAQDYSSSGKYTYPVEGAERLARLAVEGGAEVVLFAEWPRRGVDESSRIYATYAAISVEGGASLPPLPQAFDLARRRHPELVLHHPDGNHSSPAGAFLAALVLAATIDPSLELDAPRVIPGLSVDPETQARLGLVARDCLAAFAAEAPRGE